MFATPEDAAAVAAAIRRLADDPAGCAQMGDNGYRWVRQHATRETLARRYLDALERLAGGLPAEATA